MRYIFLFYVFHFLEQVIISVQQMEEQVTEVEKEVPAGSKTMERCIKSDNTLAPRPPSK